MQSLKNPEGWCLSFFVCLLAVENHQEYSLVGEPIHRKRREEWIIVIPTLALILIHWSYQRVYWNYNIRQHGILQRLLNRKKCTRSSNRVAWKGLRVSLRGLDWLDPFSSNSVLRGLLSLQQTRENKTQAATREVCNKSPSSHTWAGICRCRTSEVTTICPKNVLLEV